VNNQMTGNEARAIRRHLGLSASQLAQFMGTNSSSIYRWEWRKTEFVPPMYALALRYMLEWPRRHRDSPHHVRFPHDLMLA
jgi:DNA-binding transcriptional regulator YiaG